MSVLGDVVQYIEDNTDWDQGTTLFAAQMPDTPDAVIAVYEYAGNPPSKMGDNRSPGMQIRSRAGKSDYETARSNIEEIYTLLSAIGNEYEDALSTGVEINGTLYLHFQTVQEPFPIGPDSKGRQELAQNFIATYT